MQPDYFSQWSAVISAAASVVSAVGAFLVFKMGREVAARDRVVMAWDKFQSPEFYRQRNLAWIALKRWFIDPEFQKALLEGSHPKNRDELFHWRGFDDAEYASQSNALWLVLEFFNGLADDEFSKEEVVKRYGFYAEWWVPGLIDISNKFKERYDQYITEQSHAMGLTGSTWQTEEVRRYLPEPRWANGIKKLEILFYGTQLDLNLHPLYRVESK